MSKIRLYELNPVLEDPRYEGFAFSRRQSLLRPNEQYARIAHDFTRSRVGKGDLITVPLASVWTPQKVEGSVRPFNDYPCINLIVPCFSRNAVDVLRDLLEPNGELLPVVSTDGEYFAYNVLTVRNVLLIEESKIRWNEKPDHASRIERFVCDPALVEPLSIFLLPMINNIMVTERFVSRVREAGLRGMNFIDLWPLPPGVDWWELEKQKVRRRARKGLPEGQWLKGNTLVLRLHLGSRPPEARRKRKWHGTDQQQVTVEHMMDELDAMLYSHNPEVPAIGSLEGHEYIDDECRLFLSCPDADALVKHIEPWLSNITWKTGFIALKRYGEYVEEQAREEVAMLRDWPGEEKGSFLFARK